MLEQVLNPLASVSADGAYDTHAVYEAAHQHGQGRAVRVLIPPGRNAQLSPRPSTALKERNRNVRLIRALGRREWRTQSGYSSRSLVENTVFRYKSIIGGSMRSRSLDGQRAEVQLACGVLNTMTALGMPDSYRVASPGPSDRASVRSSEPCTNAAALGGWKDPQTMQSIYQQPTGSDLYSAVLEVGKTG